MELFNSVGIELEVENIDPKYFNSESFGFRIHRDASCESDGYYSNGMEIDVKNSSKELLELLPIRKNTIGCELVTAGVLDTSNLDYLYKLKQLTNFLTSRGESAKSYRAGFHVHINLSYNIQIIKSVLRLARHLEQVLYLLGGMGYDYRGVKNDSTYCRPLTKYGPVCVPTGRGEYSQVFTLSELLGCKKTEEFKMKYGDIARLRGNHYIPIRYHGINLLPLFTQGSLEFRMFNKSLNPYYLMAIMEFCKAFSEYAVHSSFNSLKEENLLKENSVFDIKGEQDRKKIIETFEHFLERSNLRNEQVIETLYDILSYSSVDSIVLPNKYIFSHLIFHRQGNRCPTHWQQGGYTANVIPKNKISEPNFEDIHVLRDRDRNFRIRDARPNFAENLNNILIRRNRPQRRNPDQRFPIIIEGHSLPALMDFINEDIGEVLRGPWRENIVPNGNPVRYFMVRNYVSDLVERVYFSSNNYNIVEIRQLDSDQDNEEFNGNIDEENNEENAQVDLPRVRFTRWTEGNFTTTNTTDNNEEVF